MHAFVAKYNSRLYMRHCVWERVYIYIFGFPEDINRRDERIKKPLLTRGFFYSIYLRHVVCALRQIRCAPSMRMDCMCDVNIQIDTIAGERRIICKSSRVRQYNFVFYMYTLYTHSSIYVYIFVYVLEMDVKNCLKN